jgi:hypothetical protein
MALFDAFPGEKLLIRIWDTLEKGGVGMLRPLQLRREGRAKAEVEYLQRMAISQAEKDANDLVEGRASFDPKSGTVIPALPSIPFLAAPTGDAMPPVHLSSNEERSTESRLGSAFGPLNPAFQRFALREMRQAVNIENIIEKAQAEASEVPDDAVLDKDVHPDWLARWHENAKDVSDEEVQQLWARALAGEVQSPGKYSLRTLDFLRSVSKHEAELIQRLGPLSFVGAFIFRHDESFKRLNLHFGFFTELQNLGIVAGVEAIGVSWNIPAAPKGSASIAFTCNGLGVVVSDASEDIAVPVYTISALGSQLLTLGRFSPDREYVVAFAKFVAENGAKVKLGNVLIRGHQVSLFPPIETFDPPPPPPPPS